MNFLNKTIIRAPDKMINYMKGYVNVLFRNKIINIDVQDLGIEEIEVSEEEVIKSIE